MFRILILEDDVDLNKTMRRFLNSNGYKATGCFNAPDAYDEIYKNTFDLIISDIMIPCIDGFEFADEVRKTNPDIPILFVTARGDIESKTRAFKTGVDDYMVKPIDLQELLLRIGALLRRAGIAQNRQITIGGFVMKADEYTASYNDRPVALSVREFNILYKLLSYPKKTFSRQQLMNEFWPSETNSSMRTVDVYMTKLRAKLSDCSEFDIETVYGLGYKAVIK